MKIPDEYKKGYTEFLGCHIDLRYRPLIPRVETAEWVKLAILEIDTFTKLCNSVNFGKVNKGSQVRVLDMFAGSGCVGVAVLAHCPGTTVDFVDISPKCLKQIELNCRLNNIDTERYRLIRSDVFNNVTLASFATNSRRIVGAERALPVTSRAQHAAPLQRYDVILANPPYCIKENVDASVLSFEPKQAVLGGGKDGLRLVKKFLKEAHRYLRPVGSWIPDRGVQDDSWGGVIYMEFDDFQKPLIEKLLQESKFTKWEFKKDQFGCWRWVEISFS